MAPKEGSTSVVAANGSTGGHRSNKSAELVKKLRQKFFQSYEENKYEGTCWYFSFSSQPDDHDKEE